MNKLLLMTLILFGMSFLIVQTCSVGTNINMLYPTLGETYTVYLNDIFKGENMTFINDDTDFRTVGYTDPVDSGSTLRIYLLTRQALGVKFISFAIYTQPDNQDWSGQTAFLGSIDKQFFVYPATFSSKQSPSFEIQEALLQGQTLVKCISLTYLSAHQIIVDCFQDVGGFLVNEWQIVDTEDKMQLAMIIPSSNNQKQPSDTPGFGRVIQYWKNKASGNEYLFRGTLSGQGQESFLEVFLLENGAPQKDPMITLSKLNITNLQMVDFEIAPNGTLWILNQTNVMTTYNFDNSGNSLINLSSIKLIERVNYLSIHIGIDFKFPNSGAFSILVSNTELTFNIEEWFVIEDYQPIQSGYYTVPEEMKYTGIPTQMDINTKYLSVQSGRSVYFFERGIENLSPLEYEPFKQNYVLFSTIAIYAGLNKIPQALILFTLTDVQVSLLTKPALISKMTTMKTGSFNVTAICKRFFFLEENVTISFDYDVVRADNTSIFKIGEQDLPNKTLYPLNTTIDINDYLSGPLINVSGVVTSDKKVTSETQYPKESLIIDQTSTNFNIDLKGYPTQGILYALNSYDPLQYTLLQFLQTSTQIYGYSCNKVSSNIAESDCLLMGTLQLSEKVQKSVIMYTNRQQPYAFHIIPSNNTTLNVYKVQWIIENIQGSIDDLYTSISMTIKDQPLSITDFTVISDRLFVILGEINQIWVYSLENNQAIKLYTINQSDVTTLGGFFPIGISGNFAVYGPIVFVNNQIEVLIISTVADKIEQIGSVSYPLELPGMTTLIQLVGNQLLIIEYKDGDQIQEQISQYSLVDLMKPTMVKSLPLYGARIKFPLEITSDQNFLYVLMTKNVINVYKPSASAHDTLYWQYTNLDPSSLVNMVVSATSAGQFSYVTIGNGQKIKNYQLQFKPVITFIPGSYEKQYLTNHIYILIVSNPLGSVPLILSQKISIFNSQLEIEIDNNKLAQENQKYVVSRKGQTVFNIDTKEFITGGVAQYNVDCPLCKTGDIKLINHLEVNDGYVSSVMSISAMVNYQNKLTFISTAWEIHSVSTSNQMKSVHKLRTLNDDYDYYSDCTILDVDEVSKRLLSICGQRNAAIINIQILDLTKTPYTLVMNHTMTGFFDPLMGKMIGNTIFLLATNSGISKQPIISVLNLDLIKGQVASGQNITCSDPLNNGVTDFSITSIKTITSSSSQRQTIYSILWTCKTLEQGVQYSTFILNEQTLVVEATKPQQKLNTSININIFQATNYPLLDDTIYLQVQTLSKQDLDKSFHLNIIVTTNNMMNFIFQISFQIEGTVVSFASQRIVATLPPYGLWTAMSQLSYSNGLLAIPYYNNEVKKAFLALYNLNDLDYSSSDKSPFLMFGGVYLPYIYSLIYTKVMQLVFTIQENDSKTKQPQGQILVANPYMIYLQSVTIQPHIQIVVNITAPFSNQTVEVTAENYYTQQQFNILVDYQDQPQQSKGGVRWWGWILIILAVTLLAGGVTLSYIKFKQYRRLQQPLLLVNY